jgi:hypothetical protein
MCRPLVSLINCVTLYESMNCFLKFAHQRESKKEFCTSLRDNLKEGLKVVFLKPGH